MILPRMNSRRKLLGAIIAGATLMLCVAVLSLQTPGQPPSLSIEILGYTNRTGPFALLAITNSSEYALTLSAQCLMNYSPANGPRRRTSIEANNSAAIHLAPREGFIQEVFVFPASQGIWQFEISAAPSSTSLALRKSTEDLFRQFFPSVRFPLTGRSYQRFTTDWIACPP